MRLAFLGTPEPAAVVLRAVVEAGHEVAVVVTRVDKRRGRNEPPRPTPVKQAALELGLSVSHEVEDAASVSASVGVVVAFGRIIPAGVLTRLDMVNVHFSLLPRWRGAAPVERAILAGDATTGVCLMALDEGLDTGPVYACSQVEIGPEETAHELRSRLSLVGAELLVRALEDGLGEPVPQRGEPTYAAKVVPEDLRLDWSRPALELHRVVRAGRAWTTWKARRLLVLSARVEPEDQDAGRPAGPVPRAFPSPGQLRGDLVATGAGWLRLLVVQPEGRRSLSGEEWLRGARPAPLDALGT